MTKLGTPIGAGPKGAIVVVGLARVGAPPGSNWAPPSLPSASGWGAAPGAVGGGAAPSPPSARRLGAPAGRARGRGAAAVLAAAAFLTERFAVGDAAAHVRRG